MKELTLKQWQRRAITAEEELEMIRNLRRFDQDQELRMAAENAVLRVALRDVQEATNWANGIVANTLGDGND